MTFKRSEHPDSLHLPCTPETIHWGYLSSDLESVATIQCGQHIKIDTVSGNTSRLPTDQHQFSILPDHKKVITQCKPHIGPHILTGPIHVNGAKPGDLLAVTIHDICLRQNWGWNEIEKGAGVLPELEDKNETLTIPINPQAETIQLPWGNTAKALPFFGVLAVKPSPDAGEVNSLIPSTFGGNMDIRLFREGGTLHIPIHVDGAGFSVGDGHALQGDGEVVGTAVETALTGTFSFDVVSNCGVCFPYMKASGKIIATAVSEDLNSAIRLALREGIVLLTHYFDISEKDAYRHLSLLGDVRIAQLVNIAKGVYIDIDTSALSALNNR